MIVGASWFQATVPFEGRRRETLKSPSVSITLCLRWGRISPFPEGLVDSASRRFRGERSEQFHGQGDGVRGNGTATFEVSRRTAKWLDPAPSGPPRGRGCPAIGSVRQADDRSEDRSNRRIRFLPSRRHAGVATPRLCRRPPFARTVGIITSTRWSRHSTSGRQRWRQPARCGFGSSAESVRRPARRLRGTPLRVPTT